MTEKIMVEIFRTEQYPIYHVRRLFQKPGSEDEDAKVRLSYGAKAEVPTELFAEFERIREEFNEIQKKFGKLWEEN